MKLVTIQMQIVKHCKHALGLNANIVQDIDLLKTERYVYVQFNRKSIHSPVIATVEGRLLPEHF